MRRKRKSKSNRRWWVPITALLVISAGGLGLWFLSKFSPEEAQDHAADVINGESEIAYADPPANLKELIVRYMNGQGGEEKIESLKSARIRGYILVDGIKTEFQQIKRAPNMSRLFIDAEPRPFTTVDNGDTVWREIEGLPTSFEITGEDAQQVRAGSSILGPVWANRNRPNALEMGSSREIDGVTHYSIIAKETGSPEKIFWIDSDQYLERGMDTATRNGEFYTERYSDFRKVGSLTLPFRVVTEIDGVVVSEVVIEEAELNIGVLSAFFEVPENLKPWPAETFSAAP